MALAVGLREPYTWEQELEAGDVRSVSDLAVDHRLVLVVQPQQVCGQALHFLFVSLILLSSPLCLPLLHVGTPSFWLKLNMHNMYIMNV